MARTKTKDTPKKKDMVDVTSLDSTDKEVKKVKETVPPPQLYIYELQSGKCNTVNSFRERITYVPGDKRTGTFDQFKNDSRWKRIGEGSVPEKRAGSASNEPAGPAGVKKATEAIFIFELQTGKAHGTDEKGRRVTYVPGDRKNGPKSMFSKDNRWKLIGPLVDPKKTLRAKFQLVKEERKDGLFDVYKKGESKPLNREPLTLEEANELVGVTE